MCFTLLDNSRDDFFIGSFAPAGPNTIWKKRLGKENSETLAYKLLMNDITKDVIPKFYREVEYNDNCILCHRQTKSRRHTFC